MRALIPLKMRWCCQITIDVARDDALLDLMARGRLRARADRLRVARPRQPGADAQEMERRRRRLRRRHPPLPRARHHDLRHLRVRLRRRHAGELRPRRRVRARAVARASPTSIRSRRCRAPGSTTACAPKAACCARPGGSTRRYRYGDAIFAAARHVAGRTARGPDAGAPRLLRLGLDRRSARCAARRCGAHPYKIGTMLLANWISRREIVRKQGRPLAARPHDRPRRGHAMKLTLIKPTIGRMTHSLYVDEARMEPLNLGVLAALTPEDVDVVMYDDRMEPIPYHEPTDLVAITVETYTARRSYEIADEYRRRGVPVIMGGFQPTFVPDECAAACRLAVRRRRRDRLGDGDRGRPPRRAQAALRRHSPAGRRPASSRGATSTRARATCRSACCSSRAAAASSATSAR